jgi:hypothetical protein
MQGAMASPRLHDHMAQRLMPAPQRYLRARPNGVLNSFTGNLGAALPHHHLVNPPVMMFQAERSYSQLLTPDFGQALSSDQSSIRGV